MEYSQEELFEIYKTLPDFGNTAWETPEHVKFEIVGGELRLYPKTDLASKWIGDDEADYLGFNVAALAKS